MSLHSYAEKTNKIVSIGNSVTEIVYELNQQDRLVARDSTSMYPSAARELPDVGYMRALSPEGVLSVSPNMIIAEDGSGPQETIDVLAQASIPFITIPDDPSREGVVEKIMAVGNALEVPKLAQELANKVNAELLQAEKLVSGLKDEERLKVLFILSMRGGSIMSGGAGTTADAIIDMAGGINAMNGFDGWKPVNDEAVSASAPDVILLMSVGGPGHGVSNDTLFSTPALLGTPAALNQRVVRMDGGYLLGFGPRTAAAVTDLYEALYGS